MGNLESLRIGLVHDWLTGYRGGEKVLNSICELFPDAPLHTLVHIPGTTNELIEAREIHTSFLQTLPNPARFYRHYLPLFPMAAERLGTKKYDLIISTSSAVAKSVPVGKNAKHWCFIHSPMRYVWDRFDDYFGKDKVGAVASNTVFKPVAAALRSYDVATAKRVTHFASNSDFVADRVKRYYQREAETLYAPVELERFDPSRRDPEDFYLYFSALVPYKKADHAIKACMALKKKLIVVGDGPELSQLKSIADEEYVSFRGRVADDEVVRLYSKARALLFPGVEDLGIIPIEANAAGLPVIGYAEGGLTETQTKNTCVFYDEQTVEGLISALQTFEEKEKSFKPSQLRKQAEKFAPDAFKERVLASIKSIL